MQNRFKNIKLSFVIMLTTIIVWFAADCAVFGLGKMGVEVGESARFGAQARAAEYYVDQNHSSASDSNSGTEDLPWLTSKKAGDAAKAGDTVYFKAGVYKGPLSPMNSGTPDNYITFKTFEDEEVIIEGAYEVTGWELHSGSIYKTSWDSSFLDAGFSGISDAVGFVNVDYISDEAHWLKPTVNLGDMEQTSWHYDIDNKILYVWLSDSSNPNDHTILSTKSSYLSDNIVRLDRADYVRFEGFKIWFGYHNIRVWSGRHHLEFKNIEAYNAGHDSIRTERGSSDVIFDNIKSHHNKGHGIQINGSYSAIKNSEIHHNGIVSWSRWGGAGVILMGSNNNLSNNSIHHNGYRCWGSGVLLETWGTDGEPGSDSCHHNVVEYNEIYGNAAQHGIGCSGGDNNKIRKNVIYGMNSGINIHGSGAGGSPTPEQQLAENNEIYNNVLANNQDGMTISSDNRVVNTLTRNNIFYENSQYELWVMSGEGNVFDYNNYYREGGGDGIRGAVRGSHSIVADPEFVNLASYDFSLFPTSPCIDAGTDVGLPYNGIAPDIGAYEYGATP